MRKPFILYRSGYKYQIADNYMIKISIKPKKDIETQFIDLNTKGLLTIKRGYAWDGPSGPVIDRPENMRGSLVHDALYQLMRWKQLSAKLYKDTADKLFKKLCIKDGISKNIAHIYYLGLKIGGKAATKPKNKKVVRKAPRDKDENPNSDEDEWEWD